MAGKKRKPGDWKAVASAHAAVDRILLQGRGLSNIPNLNETGSAAHRRRMKKERGR